MLSLQFFVLFLGLAFTAPLTSEHLPILDRRGSTVECSARYGWSLSTNDCYAALGKLPVTSISGNGMPDLSQAQTRQGVPGGTSSATLTRLRDSHTFLVNSGNCFIGVNPPSGGGINLSEWGSIAARAYNIVANCVTGQKGQGGKDVAGLNKNIQVMIWQEEPNEATS